MAETRKGNDDSKQRLGLFVELFSEHQRQLHIYIIGLVFSPADAYDILQDTNLVLWKNFDSFEQGTNFLAWARKIAFHRVLQFRDSKARRATTVDPHVMEAIACTASDKAGDEITSRRNALETCLDKLKQEDRLLVEKRYDSATSLRSLAEQLGRSENGISQSLRRIRRSLRDCINLSVRRADGSSVS